LQKASATVLGNEELLLLTGLVAHYAYNVDVDGTYEIAATSFEKAQQLSPNDYRSMWFLGTHQCQTMHTARGMENLLSVESRFAWRDLPTNFWDDYIACATVTNMPAHVLRAADHLKELNAPPSKMREFLVGLVPKRFITPDPSLDYEAKQVWWSDGEKGHPGFTNSMYGFSVRSNGDWKLSFWGVRNGQSGVQVEAGPHRGKAGEVFPNILVLVRTAKQNETLDDFAKEFLKEFVLKPATVGECPTKECNSYEGSKQGGYGKEGDAHAILTVFRSDAPQYPGLLFEKPSSPPESKDSSQVKYYHPNEVMHRLPGTVYYLVMLDSASSVLEKAKQDYVQFLKDMRVE
jgi:hypothetical protein